MLKTRHHDSLGRQLAGWFRRVVPRALIGLLMTATAFALVRPLTVRSDVPEVMAALIAIAVYCWFRFSVWAIRLFLQPRLDMQSAGAIAQSTPQGAAVVFAVLAAESIAGSILIAVLYLHALAIVGG